MHFELVGEITEVETIASGRGIRDLARLRRRYGASRWRKLKGLARVRIAGWTALDSVDSGRLSHLVQGQAPLVVDG